MKRMCAWCGRELNQRDDAKEAQVTHGLCPDCRSTYFGSESAKQVNSLAVQTDIPTRKRLDSPRPSDVRQNP